MNPKRVEFIPQQVHGRYIFLSNHGSACPRITRAVSAAKESRDLEAQTKAHFPTPWTSILTVWVEGSPGEKKAGLGKVHPYSSATNSVGTQATQAFFEKTGLIRWN